MKHGKIAELKNNLSRYLAQVQAGTTVIVLDRDRPVAKIVPLERAGVSGDERSAQAGTGRLSSSAGR